MVYNQFTINSVRKNFDIEMIGDRVIFDDITPVAPSDMLRQFLGRYAPLGTAIGTEKARSEFIIAPILAELTELTQHQISLFSGIDFNIDHDKGLAGRCDFILSASSIQYSLTAPVLTVVEAKNENINAGLGQCMAQMIAAQLFNQNEGNQQRIIFGTVTTGSIWRFLKLENKQISIDKNEYFLDSLEWVLGILLKTVSEGQ